MLLKLINIITKVPGFKVSRLRRVAEATSGEENPTLLLPLARRGWEG